MTQQKPIQNPQEGLEVLIDVHRCLDHLPGSRTNQAPLSAQETPKENRTLAKLCCVPVILALNIHDGLSDKRDKRESTAPTTHPLILSTFHEKFPTLRAEVRSTEGAKKIAPCPAFTSQVYDAFRVRDRLKLRRKLLDRDDMCCSPLIVPHNRHENTAISSKERGIQYEGTGGVRRRTV